MAAENKDQSEKLTKKDYIWGGLGAAATAPFAVSALFESVSAYETKAETQTADRIEPQQPANDFPDTSVMGAMATVITLAALLIVAKEGTRNHDNVLVGFSTGMLTTATIALSIFCASQFSEEKTPEDIQKPQTEIVLDKAPGAAATRNDSSVYYFPTNALYITIIFDF